MKIMSRLLFFCVLNLVLARHNCPRKELYLSTNRIIGGPRVAIEKAKFMAALILKLSPLHAHKNQLLCGVTIIGKKWALTAASCLNKVAEKLIRNGNVFVRSNTTEWIPTSHTKRDHTIQAFRKHTNYAADLNTYDFNIAIMKVTPDFTASNEKPIDIAGGNYKYEQYPTGMVYGWGIVDAENDIVQPLLMQVKLELLTYQKCLAYLKSNWGLDISHNQFCTTPRSDSGFCTGDEGGPIVQEGIAIGLMSWNAQCAVDNIPSLYTKLSSYNDWIFYQIANI